MTTPEEGLLGAWVVLADVLPDAWVRPVGDAVAGVVGVPIPSVNGLWAGSAALSTDQAGAALDEVAATGLPHCLQVDAASPARSELESLAVGRGLQHAFDLPLMELVGEPAPAPDLRLVVRRLGPDEVGVHAEVAGRGFEAPVELFEAMIPAGLTEAPGAGVFVGELEGVPVTTGVAMVLGDSVGVFNIATPPEHRRHGYGAALTAAMVRDGLDQGATTAWLQSSPDGFGVYEALGFRTIATWRCWVAE